MIIRQKLRTGHQWQHWWFYCRHKKSYVVMFVMKDSFYLMTDETVTCSVFIKAREMSRNELSGAVMGY